MCDCVYLHTISVIDNAVAACRAARHPCRCRAARHVNATEPLGIYTVPSRQVVRSQLEFILSHFIFDLGFY